MDITLILVVIVAVLAIYYSTTVKVHIVNPTPKSHWFSWFVRGAAVVVVAYAVLIKLEIVPVPRIP